MTIKQNVLISSDVQTAGRFRHTLDHGVAGLCLMIGMPCAPFSASLMIVVCYSYVCRNIEGSHFVQVA